MLTAADIAARFGVSLRSAQRLLARAHRDGIAAPLPSRGGRPPLGIAADALARLLAIDLAA